MNNKVRGIYLWTRE